MSRGHLAGLCLLAMLLCAAPAGADLPAVKSGHRPGPDVLYLAPPRAPQLENTGPWTAPPILISGASAYRDGEFLYQDFIYDDHGALATPDPGDAHGPGNHLFSPKAGTLTYPTDPVFASNAADLVELRVKPVPGATAFRVTLNTLQAPERTAFTIAIGDGPATAWPHGAGVTSPAELFLTVHGSTAELTEASGAARSPAPAASVDLERRQIDVRVPHAAWNPGTGSVRLAAGVGLWDTAAGTYLQPSPGPASASTPGGGGGAALFNLAFRGHEPMPAYIPGAGRTIADAAAEAEVQAHWWRERAQADALLTGDVSGFSATVDFGKLAARASDESGVPRSGHMNRILASRFSFGQGRDFTKECGGIEAGGHDRCQGQFTGQLQPYSVYVPKKPPPARGYGLTLLLHALSANHNQYLGSRHAEQMGERGAGSIVITPGGRGPDGFYYDVAEADVFETWADIARVYDLDPDWTAISGYSMGGIGTFRLGGRWPDLFARAAPIVATATTADNTRWLPSFRNLPMIWWVATLDELQNIAWTEETFGHLRDLGYRFSQYRFETWDHLTPATNDWYPQIAEYLGEHRVDRDPPQVTYAVSRGPDNPERGVVADHAYWLSGVRQRGDGTGVVDLRSEAFGVTAPVPTGIAQSAGVHSGGHHEPAPFTLREQAWETKAAPPADRLSGTATNIATVTVDVARARLSCAPAIDVRSDGPIDVRIACPPPPRSARRRACTARMTIRLPRVKGRRITRAVVRRGRRTVARRSGRNLRSIRIRRVTRRAHTLRVELRTANGRTRRVVLTRRVAACR